MKATRCSVFGSVVLRVANSRCRPYAELRKMKIALAQFDPTVGDFAGNSARILELAADAKRRGADLAVFSELCVCGYLPLDLLERPNFIDRARDAVSCLAQTSPLPILVGYPARVPEAHGKPIANAAALLSGGQIVFEQHKMLLPTYDVFDESRYFEPARRAAHFCFRGRKAGHHRLRRHLERQELLGQAPL